MAGSFGSLEGRVEFLTAELLLIKKQVEGLHVRLEGLAAGAGQHKVSNKDGKGTSSVQLKAGEAGSWAKMGQDLLPRLAALSFMLVFALLLRTLTDNGVLEHGIGTYIGLIYAAGLVLSGIYLYGRNSSVAPVFPVCGILLFLAVLVEGHGKFAALSNTAACLLLIISSITVGWAAIHYRARTTLFVTLWGTAVSGFAIDFPNPNFPFLSLLIFTNVLLGHLAARRGCSNALRWHALFMALLFWAMLSFKLNFDLLNKAVDLPLTGLYLFPVLLFMFWAFYTYTTLWANRVGRMERDIFHNLLPVIVAGGAYFALYAVLIPWLGGGAVVLGWAAVAVSAAYMLLAAWMVKHYEGGKRGKEFVVAAIVLLVQGLATAVPGPLALPLMFAAAAVLLVRSVSWQSSGTRAIAYVFMTVVIFWGAKNGNFSVIATPYLTGMAGSLFLALLSLWCYRWCRHHKPAANPGFLYFLDKHDYSAIILLWIGLFQFYVFFRFGVYAVLSQSMSDYESAFYCAKSVILNIGIITLMIIALKLRNKEILITAIVLVAMAAVKVFILDLFRTNGLPLIISMLTFGMVAAVSSFSLRRWGNNISGMIVKTGSIAETGDYREGRHL